MRLWGRNDKKVFLSERDIPRKWYNILADLPSPLDPPINPQTKQPLSPSDLEVIFPKQLIEQEVSQKRWVDIPEEVLNKYLIWRPTPLHRAYNLEKYLDTPAIILYKNESVSPSGSHKPNTAIPQAYYNKISGIKRLTTETGAGQWGSSLSFAGALFGLEIIVYMVKVSYNSKPYRRIMMETWGAKVFASPSNRTNFGKKILENDPNNPGSLGIAISEAIEEAVNDKNTNYSLGSVLNHVLLHQTIIGLEVKKQLEIENLYPDVIIGCVGGGSNFGGIALPFVKDKIDGKRVRIVAVEPKSCPSITRGKYAYDFGDTAGMTPLIKMHTLGHQFMPPSIHAGGLRYHGMAPIVSKLYELGLIEAKSYTQNEVFEAGVVFARTEGVLPAPETTHAIKAAIDEAIQAKKEGIRRVILFNLSGHGHFDLKAYDDYMNGNLPDHEPTEDELEKGFSSIPK
ncbi:MAG: TrpB-like pyridoxal phosphate-dependent enzyme [Brevinematales bacterium]|nr:TrpB-like pyridoxal phosphate-dependent enzyme [Brevinematales bacterium]